MTPNTKYMYLHTRTIYRYVSIQVIYIDTYAYIPISAKMQEFTQAAICTEFFYFRPERAAWYRKVASCCGLCEQPSRPFCLENNYE